MGSLVDSNQVTTRDAVNLDELVPKSEPNPEAAGGSCSSAVSTPEAEGETVAQDSAQRQKRKGGRKPIYATSEERKQRNRQAQAAFRERRTEYIKQLETTIKHNEETLQSLQQSHRSAADECLMLRYKNSLLERILLEKGIDVQAELNQKGGSPNLPTPRPAGPQPNQPSPLSRNPASRQPSLRRNKRGLAPRLDQNPSPISPIHREDSYTMRSPQLQPTPSSHVSSPSTAKSPGFALQGGISPSGTDIHAQQQQQHNNPQSHGLPHILPHPGHYSQGPPHHHHPMATGVPPADPMEPSLTPQSIMPSGNVVNNPSRMASSYYPSPFQKHYDQLEQEYDAQADMVDEPGQNHHHYQQQQQHEGANNEASHYAARGYHERGEQQQQQQRGEHRGSGNNQEASESEGFGSTSALFDHFDPMLDADPFGLTASMHFQTPFSYTQGHTQSHTRQ